MTAPTPTPDCALAVPAQPREPLEARLRELLSPPVTAEIEAGLAKIVSGVRAKLKTASVLADADASMADGLRTVEQRLKNAHNWLKAQKVIGEELGRADGQPVRRILCPPQKEEAKVPKEAEEDQASFEGSAASMTNQPVGPKTTASSSLPGRRMKWDQDREEADAFIARTVEDSEFHLPSRGYEAHPKSVDLVISLIRHLRVHPDSLAAALATDAAVSPRSGATAVHPS